MIHSSVILLAIATSIFPTAIAADLITDDTYFYGQSPAIYPSPTANGTGDWATAYAKAKELVGQLTLEEKVARTRQVKGLMVNT